MSLTELSTRSTSSGTGVRTLPRVKVQIVGRARAVRGAQGAWASRESREGGGRGRAARYPCAPRPAGPLPATPRPPASRTGGPDGLGCGEVEAERGRRGRASVRARDSSLRSLSRQWLASLRNRALSPLPFCYCPCNYSCISLFHRLWGS